MKYPTLAGLLTTGLVLGYSSNSQAGPNAKAEDYATNGKLTEDQFIEYVIDYFDIPYRELRPANTSKPPTPGSKRAHDMVGTMLFQVTQISQGKGPPYTLGNVELAMKQDPGALAAYESLDGWRKIPALTEPMQKNKDRYQTVTEQLEVRTTSGTVDEILNQKEALKLDKTLIFSTSQPVLRSSTGPFRLRRTVDSVMDYRLYNFEWKKWTAAETSVESPDITSIAGARIGFSDNRLIDGDGAWSSEGALIYPLHLIDMSSPTLESFYHAGPAVSWKIEEQKKPATAEINELKFSAPLGWGYNAANQFFVGTEPYYHTDADFDGGIAGATATFEYSTGKYLGTYGKIGGFAGRDFDMRIRAIGIADYSEVLDTSPYIKRSVDDDWFRVGAQLSLEFGFFDREGKKPPLTAGVSYRFLDDVGDEDGGSSGLVKANATWWLNPNAGLVLEYQKGETPVADKEIDIITLGFELKL